MTSLTTNVDDISNDVTKQITAWSPTGKFNYDYLETTSANIKPGMPVIRATGSGGQGKCTETSAGAGADRAYGVADLDKNMVADCDEAYASGEVIPIIPFHRNLGCWLRNLILNDPNAAINADDTLAIGDSGFILTLEQHLATAADNKGFAADATLGDNGASGTDIHDRIYVKNGYYIADPGADTRVVGYIIQG